MSREIYVNLPVADLPRARGFFQALGFSFNPDFSDDTGACMVVSDGIFVMLLTREKFAGFAPGEVADAHTQTGVLVCLSCDSRAEVDDLVQRAVAAGGRTFNTPQDHGFMYGHAFRDLDGHVWELVHMDAAASERTAKAGD